MMNDMEIHRATEAEFDAVYSIMSEAAGWLQSRGISQWAWVFTDKGKAQILTRINSAETYLIQDQLDLPIATFTLQWEDSFFWGEQGKDGLAGYVHGLAVVRRAAGKGLGAAMLDLAAGMIGKRGRGLLRLDCMPHSQPLYDYYRGLGFADKGIRALEDRNWLAQLFERAVAR